MLVQKEQCVKAQGESRPRRETREELTGTTVDLRLPASKATGAL